MTESRTKFPTAGGGQETPHGWRANRQTLPAQTKSKNENTTGYATNKHLWIPLACGVLV